MTLEQRLAAARSQVALLHSMLGRVLDEAGESLTEQTEAAARAALEASEADAQAMLQSIIGGGQDGPV